MFIKEFLVSLSRKLQQRHEPINEQAQPTPQTPMEPTFHWYQKQLNEAGELVVTRTNTLFDELSDRYLRNTFTWLLGYDARINLAEQQNDRPIRAQAAESPWLMGRNIVDLIAARRLLRDKELIQEIDRKLLHPEQGPVTWFAKHADDSSAYYANWDQRVYDTATVVEALLEMSHCYRNKAAPHILSQIEPLAMAGLRWILREITKPTAPDAARPWSTVLRALTSAAQIRPENTFQNHLATQVQEALLYLRHESSRMMTAGYDQKRNLDTSVLNGLAHVVLKVPHSLPNNLVRETYVLLDRGVQTFEEEFERSNLWSNQGENSVYLFGSMLLWAVANPLSTNDMNVHLVIRVFADLVSNSHWLYPDGSLSHDLTATTFHGRMLLALARSQLANIPIPNLYERLLQTMPSQINEERQKNFELRRQLFNLQEEQKAVNESNEVLRRQARNTRRLWLSTAGLFLWSIFFLILAHLLGILEGVQNIVITNVEALISLATAGAILVGAIWAISELYLRD